MRGDGSTFTRSTSRQSLAAADPNGDFPMHMESPMQLEGSKTVSSGWGTQRDGRWRVGAGRCLRNSSSWRAGVARPRRVFTSSRPADGRAATAARHGRLNATETARAGGDRRVPHRQTPKGSRPAAGCTAQLAVHGR